MIPHNSDIASRKEYGAIQLQRLYRGVHTRMIIRNQRYIKLNESVTKLQEEFRGMEDELIKKYGKDSVINMNTGIVKQNTDG